MIKAIAVDMDGTFLNSNSDYDRVHFEKIFNLIKKNDIRFIVASGNQYYQLKSFFPGKDDYITYVSENGAITNKNGQLLPVDSFDDDLIFNIIENLENNKSKLEFVLCGVKSAYLLKNSSARFKNFAKQYYFELKEVDSFSQLPNDIFVKVALDVDVTSTEKIVTDLNETFNKNILAVSSGHGSIDIVIPDINKGSTLMKILKEWDISNDDLLSFGDANNDLEMLKITSNSYAMENGNEQVKEVANYEAPSNDKSGVLVTIEKYLRMLGDENEQ